MTTKPPRSNRSPEVPEQLRNSSPSLLSDPRGEVSPVIVAKATLAEEPICEDCDPVRLEFDRGLYVQEFIRTQFAGVEMHIKVLNRIKAIEPFFRNLKIEDEGEWWETRDAANLAEHFARVQEVIDEQLRKTPSTQVKVKTPSGRIMDFLR